MQNNVSATFVVLEYLISFSLHLRHEVYPFLFNKIPLGEGLHEAYH